MGKLTAKRRDCQALAGKSTLNRLAGEHRALFGMPALTSEARSSSSDLHKS